MKEMLSVNPVDFGIVMEELRAHYLPLALRTWDPEEHEDPLRYLKLGVWSEIGELCTVEKRMLRGDVGKNKYDRDELVKELGDLLWYGMVWFSEAPMVQTPSHDNSIQLADLVVLSGLTPYEYGLQFDDLKKRCDQAANYDRPISVVFYTVCFCKHFKIALAEVCFRNIVKLNDRASRGLIKGSGGDR